MRIVFFGSDDFAAVHLEAVVRSDHDVVACVTQPDRRQGRGMKVVASPIKQLAGQHTISLFQPASVKDEQFRSDLRALNADLFIVVAYGQILPQSILDMPRLFCVNVHGSLLPEYRGAAPINWAIIDGQTQTGVTLIRMNEGMDAGDILAQAKMDILPEVDAQNVRCQMARLGATTLLEALAAIEKGTHTLTPQNESDVTLAPKLTKELGQIDWTKSAQDIHNRIRGLKPWPGTYTFWNSKRLKIVEAQPCPLEGNHMSGTITSIDEKGFVVATADQGLLIQSVHPEAAKLMSAQAFAVGQRLKQGDCLA